MGTKRFLAEPVKTLIAALPGRGRVLDLFCGTGAVSASLDGVASVVMNDASAFLGPLLRTRFMTDSRVVPHRLATALQTEYKIRKAELDDEFANRLQAESKAVRSGRIALREYMEAVPHAGSDSAIGEAAQDASRQAGRSRYCLVTLYFSGGYVSTRQAIALDAIRCAIDRNLVAPCERDQCLAALTITLDRVLNSAGHSAQFLRPNSERAFRRIRSGWRRDVWSVFVDSLSELAPYGNPSWRSKNEFRQCDALELMRSREINMLRAIYADPPYTKDQYSRYYHVHETTHLYDFPASTGRGRYRDKRFHSSFSSSLRVEAAFKALFSEAASNDVPLVLSYPPDGLLCRTGIDTAAMASDYFSRVDTATFDATHSTMGASNGNSSSKKVENVYVCRP